MKLVFIGKRHPQQRDLIDGANHFMDGEHEFDLLGHALDHLNRIKPAPTR